MTTSSATDVPDNAEKPDTRAGRKRKQLIEVALRLIIEHGARGVSMAAIAREAGASKETLYRYFGDRNGLFAAVVENNATENGLIRDFYSCNEGDPRGFLAEFGEALLMFLMDSRSVAINRLVITEAARSPEYGQILERSGRAKVVTHVAEQFQQYRLSGQISDQAAQSLELFFALLIRNSQLRLLDGSAPALDTAAIRQRADDAARLYLQLYAPTACCAS